MLRTLFKTVKKWKPLKCPSTKCGVIHTMGYHSIIKRNEALICVTAWMNLRALR